MDSDGDNLTDLCLDGFQRTGSVFKRIWITRGLQDIGTIRVFLGLYLFNFLKRKKLIDTGFFSFGFSGMLECLFGRFGFSDNWTEFLINQLLIQMYS